MSRCSHCNREFPDGGAFCPYCGTPNAQPPVTPKPSNNRVKITLIIAVAAVVTAAIILAGIIIANSNKPQHTPVPAASTVNTTVATAPSETSVPATTAALATERPTEPPTTAPPTTAAPTAAPTSPGKDTYHNAQYGWSVDIPEEWYEYGTVIEAESATADYVCPLRFMYKEAYESIHAGHVFTIYAVPAGSSKDDGQTGGNPAGGFLGRNSQYAFYWWKATDVQVDSNGPDGKRQSEEYKTLSDMRQTILDSFRLDE